MYVTPTSNGYGGVIIPAGVGNTNQQTQQQTTVYVQQTTAQQQTVQTVYNAQGYCSTLYADGPGLPTTRAGQCGTILVLNEGTRDGIGFVHMAGLVGGLHLLGGLLLALRVW